MVAGAAAVVVGITWTAWPAAWPAASAQLEIPALPEGGEPRRIYLDAGHGAEDNVGNRGALDQLEQSFTLALATDIQQALADVAGVEIRVSRAEGELVAYRDRVSAAEAWPADVFISLHSDVRHPDAVGFSILWSDEGDASLVTRRVTLARSMAEQLSAIGLPAYNGDEYVGLYEGDLTDGVFVDRHQTHQRIFVLRKPTMPSIIIETHNAKSVPEARRWEEAAVRRAFAHALARVLAP